MTGTDRDWEYVLLAPLEQLTPTKGYRISIGALSTPVPSTTKDPSSELWQLNDSP